MSTAILLPLHFSKRMLFLQTGLYPLSRQKTRYGARNWVDGWRRWRSSRSWDSQQRVRSAKFTMSRLSCVHVSLQTSILRHEFQYSTVPPHQDITCKQMPSSLSQLCETLQTTPLPPVRILCRFPFGKICIPVWEIPSTCPQQSLITKKWQFWVGLINR